MTLGQLRLYLQAAERHEARAFKRLALAARSAWLKPEDFKTLAADLPD